MERNSKLAEQLCSASKELSANAELLSNMENYLSRHFDAWMLKFANTPAGLVDEFCDFANIEFDDPMF